MKKEIDAAYARIRGLVSETPVEEFRDSVFLKLEHLQATGSFRFRGASNRVALLTAEQAAAGVVTASNGNHGLGVAAAARARGIAVEVFVSSHVAPAKARRIAALGAQLRGVGDDPLTAELEARRAAGLSGRTFISPYNDLAVMAGQGRGRSRWNCTGSYRRSMRCWWGGRRRTDRRHWQLSESRVAPDRGCGLLA